MQGHGIIYVPISFYSARCQVGLPLRPRKISYIQIHSLFLPWRIQHERKV